ncbi:MAG: aminotransferase class V-fold PLP-dependent enzyme [Christensenellales bacterium]
MIYFDNAATSLPKPPTVGQAILKAMETFGGAGRGGHPASLHASRCIFKARKAVADLLGSAPERTVFTCNATESLNIAIGGLLKADDHVITTALEHNSVLRPLYRLRAKGMPLSIVPADTKGNLDYDQFRKCLRPNTKAVVCTHASNVTGTILDLEFIASFCKDNHLLFIVDASQTAGVFPINADGLGIDVLCFTGHKGLLGPQGTGGLCVRQGLSIPSMKVGGSGIHSYSEIHPVELPEALEAGTPNAHGIAGLFAGIEYIRETGMETIRNQELALCRQFVEGVQSIQGVRVYGDHKRSHAPIVSLNINNLDSGDVGDRLANQYGICVRSGAHCAPLIHMTLGTQNQGAVRFSFSSFNTDEEIQAGIDALVEIAGGKR